MAKNFRITFPIAKTEKLPDGRMLVRGIATSDAIDKQGDRLPFSGSVKAVQKWLDTGPAVREQHDPLKAVGSGLSFTPMPDDGAIAVEVFISAAEQGTQTKLDEKVLRAFSIGGTPLSQKMVKVGDKLVKEIPEWEMEELSIVDRPANPDCKILFTKAGTILTEEEAQVATKNAAAKGKTEGEEAKPPEGTPPEGKPPEGEGTKPPEGEGSAGEGKPGEGEQAGGEGAGGKPPEPPAKPAVGQESGKEPPPSGEQPPAPPEVKINDEQMGQIVAKVTDGVLAAIREQTDAVKAMTAAMVKAAVGAFRKSDANQIVIWDMRLALDCLDMLMALLSYEEGEAASGSKEPPIQTAKLKAASTALSEFIVSEAGELLGQDDVILASARPIKLIKSAPAAEPVVLPEIGAKIETLTKAVEGITGTGGAESFRDAVSRLQKGIEAVLSRPVPGHAPARFAAAAAQPANEKSETVRILENMLAKADPLSRPAIERELNMLRARS